MKLIISQCSLLHEEQSTILSYSSSSYLSSASSYHPRSVIITINIIIINYRNPQNIIIYSRLSCNRAYYTPLTGRDSLSRNHHCLLIIDLMAIYNDDNDYVNYIMIVIVMVTVIVMTVVIVICNRWWWWRRKLSSFIYIHHPINAIYLDTAFTSVPSIVPDQIPITAEPVHRSIYMIYDRYRR